MKILQVVPYFYPAWSYGGPAKLVYDISKTLTTQGDKVTVITTDAFDSDKRMPADKRITETEQTQLNIMYVSNISNWLAYRCRIFFGVSAIWLVPIHVSQNQVIHLHDFFTLIHVWACIWAKLLGKPYIISVHGTLEPAAKRQRSYFKQIFMRLFGNAMLNNAHVLLASSEKEYNDLSSQFEAHKVRQLGHGVDPAEFISTKTHISAKTALDLPINKTIVTYLGRISRLKGLDMLVEVIAQLKKSNVHFVIAGSDNGFLADLKADITRLGIQEKVELLSTTSGSLKSDLFEATDIFVYPSYSEGFSVGILEFLSTGKPVLITEGCNFTELATKEAGMVVKTDTHSILVGLQRLLGDEKLQQSLGKNASKLIRRKYSWPVIGQQLTQIYQSVLEK